MTGRCFGESRLCPDHDLPQSSTVQMKYALMYFARNDPASEIVQRKALGRRWMADD
jgi:hypothetical protein